jgi:hypothetical protein
MSNWKTIASGVYGFGVVRGVELGSIGQVDAIDAVELSG